MFEIVEEIEFTQEDIDLYNTMLRTTRENITLTTEKIGRIPIQDIVEVAPYKTRIDTELTELKRLLHEGVKDYKQLKRCIGNVLFHLGEVEREMIQMDYEITELLIDDENRLDLLHNDIMICKEELDRSIAGLLI